MIDFRVLKERFDLLSEIEKDLGQGKRSGRWVMFHCPFPGHKNGDSNPSLAITQDNGQYYCFACGRSGDLITWLQEYRGLSWSEICDLAGSGDLPPAQPRPAAAPLEPMCPPGELWQERGLAFVEECETRLWQPDGEQALAWLLEKRGLAADTIRRYRLGFQPAEVYEPRKAWGLPEEPDSKQVLLPRGITIPCFEEGVLWYINVRRPDGKPKYKKIAGSKAALFGANNLRGAEIALLAEGELDCVLADQELGDVAGVATLGSASSRLDLATWGRYLLPAKTILVAYDLDPAGAAGLSALLGQSMRFHTARVPVLRPGDKDITDYHNAGGDLWKWFNYILFERINYQI